MAIIDRIKFDGSSNGSQWLVYKCPSEQFVIGSQLIVNEGQEALFFKGGKALDLFGLEHAYSFYWKLANIK